MEALDCDQAGDAHHQSTLHDPPGSAPGFTAARRRSRLFRCHCGRKDIAILLCDGRFVAPRMLRLRRRLLQWVGQKGKVPPMLLGYRIWLFRLRLLLLLLLLLK
jgi:hypothetical protein